MGILWAFYIFVMPITYCVCWFPRWSQSPRRPRWAFVRWGWSATAGASGTPGLTGTLPSLDACLSRKRWDIVLRKSLFMIEISYLLAFIKERYQIVFLKMDVSYFLRIIEFFCQSHWLTKSLFLNLDIIFHLCLTFVCFMFFVDLTLLFPPLSRRLRWSGRD